MTSKTTNNFTGGSGPNGSNGFGSGSEYPSRWAAIEAKVPKIGCSGHTLLEWVKKVVVDGGKRAGISTNVAKKLKVLERENRDIRQANESLCDASAYFATAELDRRSKP